MLVIKSIRVFLELRGDYRSLGSLLDVGSLDESPPNSFNFEDRSSSRQVPTIFCSNTKDRKRVVEQLVHREFFLSLITIENPLVNLEPSESGRAFSLFPDMTRDLSPSLPEQPDQVVLLVV